MKQQKLDDTMKKDKIEIKIEKLEEVANYYEFPLVVFFTSVGELKGTRKDNLLKHFREQIEKIKEIADEL